MSDELERSEAIKRARAAQLARPVEQRSQGRGALSSRYLVFGLGRERYGIPVQAVERILRLPEITRLPGAPGFVAGAVSLVGEILTALELRRLFGVLGETLDPGLRRLVVVEARGERVGLVVDEVQGVEQLQSWSEHLPTGGWLRPDQVRGLASSSILLLELEQVLADPRLRVGTRDQV